MMRICASWLSTRCASNCAHSTRYPNNETAPSLVTMQFTTHSESHTGFTTCGLPCTGGLIIVMQTCAGF